MGRKNKSKKGNQSSTGATSDVPAEVARAIKKEVLAHCTSLLEKCSQPAGTGAKELEDFLEIQTLVEKIRTLQKDVALPSVNRDINWEKFINWLHSSNVDTSCVEVAEFPGYGFGLKATKDLKEGEQFLTVPRDLMMTPQSAKATALGPLIAEDKILQVMPSVVLALHLLCERRSPDSRWAPYLDILPQTYTIPLYFTQEDLKYLKGSPAYSDCINQYRNIARQYAYFYRLFQGNSVSADLPIKENFTYDDYRWAVATVMTRQNQIPMPDGSKMTFALIPLWDMCNHCNGLITTDFDLDKSCSQCYALQNFTKGEQVFIFYGPRSNAELLVNNGFVYPENEHNRMAIKLGISKGDTLFTLKSELLSKCGLLPSRTFFLHTGKFPVDTDLLTFLRIFLMDESTLQKYSEVDATPLREELSDLDRVVNVDVDAKVWIYLGTRANLLLKAYDTTAEEDDELLKKKKVTGIPELCVQLRKCEKHILQSTIAFTEEKNQALETQAS